MAESEEGGVEAGGIVASARRVTSSVVGLLQTRFELFGLEVREQELRAMNLLVWAAVGLGLAIATVLVAIGTLALLLWRTTGYWGLVTLLVLLLAGTFAVFALIKRRITAGPAPFAATAAEFRKDFECLKRVE